MTEGLTAEAVLARHVWSQSFTANGKPLSYCSCGKPWPCESDAVQLARQLLAAQERVAELETWKSQHGHRWVTRTDKNEVIVGWDEDGPVIDDRSVTHPTTCSCGAVRLAEHTETPG